MHIDLKKNTTQVEKKDVSYLQHIPITYTYPFLVAVQSVDFLPVIWQNTKEFGNPVLLFKLSVPSLIDSTIVSARSNLEMVLDFVGGDLVDGVASFKSVSFSNKH